jgi:hypothetical protein
MNEFWAGPSIIVVGIALLIFHHRSKFLKENTALEIPYLKNAGIGFIAMGLILLAEHVLKR